MKIPRLFILISLVLMVVLSFYLAHLRKKQTITNRGEESVDFCQAHCQDPTCRGKPEFYDEDCCLRIQQTGDPTQCPWPQRGWCMPEHCATIPEGVSRLRCAGPRQVWCDLCRQNNCPGFVNQPTPIQPTTPPPQPTLPPPTATPTTPSSSPTRTPFIPPKPITLPVFPTTIVPFLPEETPKEPLPTAVSAIDSFFRSVKTVNFPKTKIDITTPFSFFESLFKRIIYYDRLLEENINTKLKKIFNF